jgi:4-hydroxy-tetrahydrodipicolinate synthase
MTDFGRVITAMVTPFDKNMKVDYKRAKELAKALLASGSDSLVLSGTTGECPTLSFAERLRLFAEVKEAVGKKGLIIAGTGNNDTAESVELTREAEKFGVDGILIVVPYYNKPTQEGIFQHFKAIAGATRLPCIAYNVPSRTVVNMTAETCLRLPKIKNIIGVKEASGNLEQIGKIIDSAPKDFIVWSGNDGDTFPIIAMGGYGIISVISHLVGKQLRKLVDLTVASKNDQAAAQHHKLMPLVNAMFVVSNPIPVKYALNYVGFNVGKPRLPLVEPDEKTKAVIESALKQYKIDLPIKK